LDGSFVSIGLEFEPPHFPSPFLAEAIITRTKSDGAFAVVEGVYENDEGRLDLSCVSKNVVLGCLEGFENPTRKLVK
jgi:hypothetical protein